MYICTLYYMTTKIIKSDLDYRIINYEYNPTLIKKRVNDFENDKYYLFDSKGEFISFDFVQYQLDKNKELEEKKNNNSAYYRAKSTILDYAKNNRFNYFCTITFENSKIDISNEEKVKKVLLKYLANLKSRHDSSLKYIIIAQHGELNGRLHFHGLFYTSLKMERHIDSKNKIYFRLPGLFEKFGACRFDRIYNYEIRVVNYITRYITRSNFENKLYKYNYFCSKGLKRSKLVYHSDDIHINSHSNDLILNAKIIDSINVYLREKNLFYVLPYCSICTLTIEQFEDLINIHNLLKNDNFKQISFNDIP